MVFFIIFLFPASVFCQTGKFNEEFNKEDKGWRFSKITNPDSAEFSIKDGSLFIKNKNSKTAIVQYNLSGNSVRLGKDDILDIRLKIRHLGGVNNYGYGINFGGKPDTYFEDGTNITLAANGNYTIYHFYGQRQNNDKPWTIYPPIKKTDGEVNEIRLIKFNSTMHLLINGTWAFTGGLTAYNDYISFFVQNQQEVAVDEINIKSYRGSFNKFPKHNTDDLFEICRESANDFANAKGFEKDGQFKTWLSEVFICNKTYPISKADKDFFPKKVKIKKEYFVYSIATDFKELADKDKMKSKLTGIIEQALINFTVKVDVGKEKKSTYFLSTNSDLPAGVIVKLSEYTDRRSYENEDHYYIKLEVLAAPDIKPF